MQRFDGGIRYVMGDATQPSAVGNKIIAHVCNDVGKWGKGFVLALRARFPQSEHAYRSWHMQMTGPGSPPFELGQVQAVQVAEDLLIVNMIAQHDVASRTNVHPLDYVALEACLNKLADLALLTKASVHMPRIGCGLGGGEWTTVETIIMRTLVAKNVATVVYDYLPN